MAAYRYAYKKPSEVDSIIMIAPGIAPRLLIGDKMKITEETLNSNDFSLVNNPHIDPINPKSPLVVPFFATNLMLTSGFSRGWKISDEVRGHVFLSDRSDSYVNSDKTIKVLKKNAPHFEYTFYERSGALHELDNERVGVSDDLLEKSISF